MSEQASIDEDFICTVIGPTGSVIAFDTRTFVAVNVDPNRFATRWVVTLTVIFRGHRIAFTVGATHDIDIARSVVMRLLEGRDIDLRDEPDWFDDTVAHFIENPHYIGGIR